MLVAERDRLEFVCGCRVILQNLTSRPEFNGQAGTVVLVETERISVCLDDAPQEERLKRLRAKNLRLGDGAAPPPPRIDVRALCKELESRVRSGRDEWRASDPDALSPVWTEERIEGQEATVRHSVVEAYHLLLIASTNIESSVSALRSEALAVDLFMMSLAGDASELGRSFEARARRLEPGCMVVAALLANRLGEDERYMALLRDGAALGSALCQYTLGDLIMSAGVGTDDDAGMSEKRELAIELFMRSAEGGSAYAAHRIALVHRDADDVKEASVWYERAAGLGSDDAMCALAEERAAEGRVAEGREMLELAAVRASPIAKRSCARRLVRAASAAEREGTSAELDFAASETLLWEAVAAGEGGEAWWTLAMLTMREPSSAPPLLIAALCARFEGSVDAVEPERRAQLRAEVPHMVRTEQEERSEGAEEVVSETLAAGRRDADAQSFISAKLAAAARRNMEQATTRYLLVLERCAEE